MSCKVTTSNFTWKLTLFKRQSKIQQQKITINYKNASTMIIDYRDEVWMPYCGKDWSSADEYLISNYGRVKRKKNDCY